MKGRFGLSGLLAVLLLTLPAIAADKKKEPAAPRGTNPSDYQALADAHLVTGKLISVSGSDKSLSLRVDYQVSQPNPNAGKGRARGRAINQTFKVVNEHKDFDLPSTPTAVVRYLEPPALYDDKGYPKKYTAAELKEMKGKDPNLPGYSADFDKLAPGQSVRVTLVKPKADKGKPKDKDAADDKKPQVSMIVILAEAPQTDKPAPKTKKTK